MPKDGNRIGLPYDRLRDSQNTFGVGGQVECSPETAFLAFYEDDRSVRVYDLNVDVLLASGQTSELPSLLGRDILNCWRMTYAPRAAQLDFEVLEAHATIPMQGPQKLLRIRRRVHGNFAVLTCSNRRLSGPGNA